MILKLKNVYKRYFLASLTALCIMVTLSLAIYLDNAKMVQKNAMLETIRDSLDIQIKVREQHIIKQEMIIESNSEQIRLTK